MGSFVARRTALIARQAQVLIVNTALAMGQIKHGELLLQQARSFLYKKDSHAICQHAQLLLGKVAMLKASISSEAHSAAIGSTDAAAEPGRQGPVRD